MVGFRKYAGAAVFSIILCVTAAGCDQSGKAASRSGASPKRNTAPVARRDFPLDADSDESASRDESAEPTAGASGAAANETALADAGVLADDGAHRKIQVPDDAETPKSEFVELPDVRLSQQHKETCLLGQGDVLPDFKLTDVDGQQHSLSSLYGTKLTVICFWDSDNPLSAWELADLGPDVADAYAGHGVKVIAINHRQSATDVREIAERVEASYPMLLDPEGTALAAVATRYLPRTYVVDAEGRILWFDFRYQSETRRHLYQAIQHVLSTP